LAWLLGPIHYSLAFGGDYMLDDGDGFGIDESENVTDIGLG